MRLVRLAAEGFRNLAQVDVPLDGPFVVVWGDNGQGKTNLLEAIWLLSTLRPLRTARTREVIGWGRDAACVAGEVVGVDGPRRLRVDLGARRTARLDDVETRDLQEYFSAIRTVAFAPQDAAIVGDGPDERRAWLDRAAFTARPAHLDVVLDHARLLAQKGALLRQDRPDPTLLDVLDDALARAGAELAQRRAALLAEVGPHVVAMHEEIAGDRRPLEVVYRTDAAGETWADRVSALRGRAGALRAEELRRRTALWGVQRDDLRISLDGQPMRAFGSRGQVRSVVLAMKLAELAAAHARGQRPIFLLDDLSSELDRARTGRLMTLLAGLVAQVVVTTTDPDLLLRPAPGQPGVAPEDLLRLRVRDGVVERG
jgi:DNA replication and repair protein RecF